MEKVRFSFRRPEKQNVAEFERIIELMRGDLDELCRTIPSREQNNALIKSIAESSQTIRGKEDMYFWGLDRPDRMPADARVDFFCTPSYIVAAMLMRALMIDGEILRDEQFRSLLIRALNGSTVRNLRGHGYDGMKGQIEALEIFIKAGLREFIAYYPSICPAFTKLIKTITQYFKKAESQGCYGIWGEDYTDSIEQIVEYFSKTKVFVYGTLMSGETNHRYYLSGKKCMGTARISGYDMYDIGMFPGIVKGMGEVIGEVYEIDTHDLRRLDNLEGEGSLYIRQCKPVAMENGEIVLANVYEYSRSIEGLEQIPVYLQPYTSE